MSKPHEMGLAVLTGDLIGYTNWSEAKRKLAFQALQGAAADVSAWPGADGSSHLERVRGDGWQFALTVPGFALRAALVFRAALRGAEAEFGAPKRPLPDLDTRIAVGIGPHSHFNPSSLAGADGPTFVRSGRELDDMAHAPNISFAANDKTSQIERMERAIVRMCDAMSRRWTGRQAAVMYVALSPEKQTGQALAQRLGIRRQSVDDHLGAAQASAIMIGLEEIERTHQ
ncbi:MAG: hypothetical protein AAGJ84_01220 [Pseudomonadota bacterium]